jgi:hypothetical protein
LGTEIKALGDRLGLFSDRLGLFAIPVRAFCDSGVAWALLSRVFSAICRAAATLFFTSLVGAFRESGLGLFVIAVLLGCCFHVCFQMFFL